VLTLDGVRVFYPSDTDFLGHHEAVQADVVLPPIGGHYTMNRHQAADFARAVDPDLVLPVHYDTFDGIDTDAEAFAVELRDDGIDVALF
jgi:L-ascorbate metabolism protein UlaG (beta-lactamase superfamily)